jgi:glycosyltransferase involved in cell wall biosynthesis
MITEKLTCMASNHLLPEGNGVKGALQEYITKKEMTVLGYGNIRGINLKTFDRTPEVLKVASKLKIDGVFTFLYVGRIVKDKGVDVLITAFCRLHGEYPETRLVLVGPYEDKLNPISDDTHVAINTFSAIEAVGLKMGLELLAYYAASDCFVFPSYREGFPNVVIEAGAMSLPSIVTDIFGSNEIVEDGVNGLIVPPQDSVSLYDAMKRIFNDAFLRTSLANKARPMIASRYEESFVQKCLIDYYHQIIKQQYLM